MKVSAPCAATMLPQICKTSNSERFGDGLSDITIAELTVSSRPIMQNLSVMNTLMIMFPNLNKLMATLTPQMGTYFRCYHILSILHEPSMVEHFPKYHNICYIQNFWNNMKWEEILLVKFWMYLCAISLLSCQMKQMACQKIRHLAIQYVIVLYLFKYWEHGKRYGTFGMVLSSIMYCAC